MTLSEFCLFVSCCSFDEFLMDMRQGKRKNIRQERKKVGVAQLDLH